MNVLYTISQHLYLIVQQFSKGPDQRDRNERYDLKNDIDDWYYGPSLLADLGVEQVEPDDVVEGQNCNSCDGQSMPEFQRENRNMQRFIKKAENRR